MSDSLDWNSYDFIEEGHTCSPSPLSFTEVDETIISESTGTNSPYKILGRCCGVFQEVGGFSRNGRYYPPEHWSRILEDTNVQERIKGRRMLGTIGHDDSRVQDCHLREGRISHVVSKLEIHEDETGKPFLYGELEILDTPTGRILKGLYEGGVGLYVSSRGAGKLLDTPGKPYKTVAPQFFLEGFDVVLNPGFLVAKPVFEQVQENKFESKNVCENDTAAKKEMQGPSLNETTEQSVQEDPKATNEDISFLKAQVEKLAKIVEKVVDNIYELPEEEQVSESKFPPKESLVDFVKLMSETNISEEAFCEVLDLILKEEK